MRLTRKQFEFLKFVQGGDDWHCDCFVEIVEKYFQGRKNGCLTNPPFPHRSFNHSDNSVIGEFNRAWLNAEFRDEDIYIDGQPITSCEYYDLLAQLKSLSIREISSLQSFLNSAIADDVDFVDSIYQELEASMLS
jgi:hypothetical protein